MRDEGSLNGVYIRVRGTVDIAPGDTFLAGEQLFRIDPTPRAADGQDPDGTYFYSSPKYLSPFRLTQRSGIGVRSAWPCVREGSSLQVGLRGGRSELPDGSSTCPVRTVAWKNMPENTPLTDLNSRNGNVYVRIKTERDYAHGDYLFIGRKLLRVELNTN